MSYNNQAKRFLPRANPPFLVIWPHFSCFFQLLPLSDQPVQEVIFLAGTERDLPTWNITDFVPILPYIGHNRQVALDLS
jgi:hypothetical protein